MADILTLSSWELKPGRTARRDRKKGSLSCLFRGANALFCGRLFSGWFARVTLAKLLYTAGRVHDLVFAGVERVRFRGNLDLYEWIFLAIGPFDRLAALGIHCRARQKLEVAAGVDKDHFFVIGVNIGSLGISLFDVSGSSGHKLKRACRMLSPWRSVLKTAYYAKLAGFGQDLITGRLVCRLVSGFFSRVSLSRRKASPERGTAKL